MNGIKIFITLISALLLATACAKDETLAGSDHNKDGVASNEDDIIKGWVRIKLKPESQALKIGTFTRSAVSTGNEELDRIAAEFGATEVCSVFGEGGKFAERRRKYGLHLWYDLKIDEDASVAQATRAIGLLDIVDHVHPILKIYQMGDERSIPAQMVFTPSRIQMSSDKLPFNDPGLRLQWHYNNDGTVTNNCVAGADINLFEGWKTTAGNKDIIVAIMDGGIDYSHPDLAANMWINTKEIPGNGIDDDDNGYIDDIYGWNSVKNSGAINPASHGTHVAGTVAAVNNNGIGVCGVAGGTGNNDGVRLMSCQNIDGASSRHPAAFLYAAENGAVISQNSWGFSDGSKTSKELIDAMNYFIKTAGTDEHEVQIGPMKGGVIIFATGNNSGSAISYPAAEPFVIAVTAMSPDYKRATYSQYGPGSDIFAPGGADNTKAPYVAADMVYSTDLNGGYGYKFGTSMACPHVSGVAALIVSKYGKQGFTAQDLKDKLLGSVRPVSDYVSEPVLSQIGSGLVDAGLAFIEDSKTPPAKVTNAVVTEMNNVLKFSWTVPEDGNKLAPAQFIVSYTSKSLGKFVGIYPDSSGEFILNNYTKVGTTYSGIWTAMYNTEYVFNVVVVDRFGNKSDKVVINYTTGDYTNKTPALIQRLPSPIEFNDNGEEYKMTFELSKFFSDANISDGDIITYSVTNRDPSILSATIKNGKLVLVPLYKGSVNLSVEAKDIDGKGIVSSTVVKILDATKPPVVLGDKAALQVVVNPVVTELKLKVADVEGLSATLAIYDSASRKVMETVSTFDSESICSVNVAKLSAGMYSVKLTVDGKSGRTTFVKK